VIYAYIIAYNTVAINKLNLEHTQPAVAIQNLSATTHFTQNNRKCQNEVF